jgi:hypothetical protein
MAFAIVYSVLVLAFGVLTEGEKQAVWMPIAKLRGQITKSI